MPSNWPKPVKAVSTFAISISCVENGYWSKASGRSPPTVSVRLCVWLAKLDRPHTEAETWLALAKLHLHQLTDARHEAEQFSKAGVVAHRALAELWLAIGDTDEAKKHAVAAYKSAWAMASLTCCATD